MVVKTMKELSWTPSLQKGGSVYCSPACGYGCTRASYELADARAKSLCDRLGKGWKPRVWENLGWHWKVERGLMSVHHSHSIRSRNKTWRAQWEGGFPQESKLSAKHAILSVVNALREKALKANEDLKEAEKIISRWGKR